MPHGIAPVIQGNSVNAGNLRRLREEAGLTRTELARLAGTEYGHIWRMEAGHRDCLSETLRKIADVLAETLDRSIGTVLEALTDPR